MDTIMNRLERELEQIERQLAGLRFDVDAAESRRSTLAGAKDRLQAAATDAEALLQERPLELSGEPREPRSAFEAAQLPADQAIAPGEAAAAPAAPVSPRTGRSRRERLLERLEAQRPDLLEQIQRGELGANKAAVLAGWHKPAARPKRKEIGPLSDPEPTPEPADPPRITSGVRNPQMSGWPRAVEQAELELAEVEVLVERAKAEGAFDDDVAILVNRRRAATAKVERLKAAALNSTAVQVPLGEPHHRSRHG